MQTRSTTSVLYGIEADAHISFNAARMSAEMTCSTGTIR